MTMQKGVITTDFGGDDDLGNSVAIQADGKIVVAGSGQNSFTVARYNPSGSLDALFDTDGKVITGFGAFVTYGYDLAIQSDGKIIVVGNSTSYDFNLLPVVTISMARYNKDGGLDSTFDGDGKVSTGGNYGLATVVQNDSKILVTGGDGFKIKIVRYDTNGSEDVSFGSNGTASTDITNNNEEGNSVAVQKDGKIVVVGSIDGAHYERDSGIAVVRYNADGSLDYSFNNRGMYRTAAGDGYDVAIQNDGKIVVVGSTNGNLTNGNFFLIRYNSNGSLDTTFAGGAVITDFNYGQDAGRSVVIQNDGKIIVAGESNNDFALARYNSDSTLDTSFGNLGKVITDIGGKDGARSVALQDDGKIVVTGFSDGNFAVARYNSDGSLDPTFNGWDNCPPTGSVTIDGNPLQGQMLTATNTLADCDGLGVISYQWQVNGIAIKGAGAMTASYTPTTNDLGKTIAVVASYTDGLGKNESVISVATKAVSVSLNSSDTHHMLKGSSGNDLLNGNAGNDKLTGFSGDDILKAGQGDDVINGGKGNDTLTGGTGRDTFIFDAAIKTGIDKITDFNVIDDTIQLENAVFSQLAATGVLNADNFVINKFALDSNANLIYNPNTGALSYDADGILGWNKEAVQIAILGKNLPLTHTDFIVV